MKAPWIVMLIAWCTSIVWAENVKELAPGLQGDYFDVGKSIPDFSAIPPGRTPTWSWSDKRIHFQSTTGGFPGTGLTDFFYVRWKGRLRIAADDEYTFYLTADDRARLLIEGQVLIDTRNVENGKEASGRTQLKAGDHDIQIDFYENVGAAKCELFWESRDILKQIVPDRVLFHERTIENPQDIIQEPSDSLDSPLPGVAEANRRRFFAQGGSRVSKVTAFGDRLDHYASWLGTWPLVYCRQTSGQTNLAWQVALPGKKSDKGTWDFKIPVGMGYFSQPAGDFYLTINGQKAFTFQVALTNQEWQSADGSVKAAYEVRQRNREGSNGILSLELAGGLARAGETATFEVKAVGPESLRWFGVHLCSLSPLPETQPSREFSYHTQIWRSGEGLPHDTVFSITQTLDGYLWIGTAAGLVRFDGVRFTPFNRTNTAALLNQTIYSLCPGHDGSLWVGTFNGGLLRLKEGVWSHFGETNGLPSDAIRSLLEATDGSMWIGTTNGLCHFQNGKFHHFTTTSGLSQNVVRSICEDRRGNIWIATGGGLSRWNGGRIDAIYDVNHGSVDLLLRAACVDQQGQLWMGGNGLYRLQDGGPASVEEELTDNNVTVLYADKRNQLWIGTYGGLHRLVGDVMLTETKMAGATYDQVNAIFEDREGNIWIGAKDGLHRLTPQRFTSFTKEDGLSHNNVMVVREDAEGALWMTTWGGGLNRLKNGQCMSFAMTSGFISDQMLALEMDHEGSLWIGMDYNVGLYRLKDRALTHYAKAQGLRDPAIRVILEDSQRRLWVGTSGALYIFRNDRFDRFGVEEGLGGPLVHALLEDRAGNLWAGTTGGLSQFEDGRFVTCTTRDGLPHNNILALHEDAAGDIWVGTGEGLCRMKIQSRGGQTNSPKNLKSEALKFSRYTSKQGLPDTEIFEILEDDFGWLWLSSPKGVFRVRKQDLDDLDQGRLGFVSCELFDRKDGLASAQCNGVAKPAAWKSQDGRLWFATTRGVSVVDPGIKSNDPPSAPPVVIEEVLADKKIMPRTGFVMTDTISIPPGRGDLEIHYTALGFRTPERIRFKYKLEGFDSDWVDARDRRAAFYNNLRPADYTFRVQAGNNGDAWTALSANVKFTLQPHYWQTWWFKTLVILASVACVGTIARYTTKKRMQLKLERLEQQHAIEKERTRIAKDIHDDIGSSLTRIKLLGELVQADKNNASEVATHAQKIAGSVRETVQALDEIVWAVDPENDTLNGLAEYLGHYTTEFFEDTEVRCRLELPVDLPAFSLSSEARHNVFLVVKEALNNALKYSNASQVTIRLAETDGLVKLEISDDGSGFDWPKASVRQGNGLNNMRERMEAVGGRLEISTAPGKGTRIRLEIPIHR
jgi:ligand-binding sensor domain-containing protein/signal transduction histidine kinase